MPFQLVETVYWLALSTWFGGVVFVMVAAQVILQTMREAKPVLPQVLSVNLEGKHGTLLAGTIMGNLISTVARIEMACAGVLLFAIGAQWFMTDLGNKVDLLAIIVRSAFYLGATLLVLYDWKVLWPRIWKFRQEYIDHADDPDKANPASEEFDRHQSSSLTLWTILTFLLLGIVLFSGGIHPQAITFSAGRG